MSVDNVRNSSSCFSVCCNCLKRNSDQKSSDLAGKVNETTQLIFSEQTNATPKRSLLQRLFGKCLKPQQEKPADPTPPPSTSSLASSQASAMQKTDPSANSLPALPASPLTDTSPPSSPQADNTGEVAPSEGSPFVPPLNSLSPASTGSFHTVTEGPDTAPSSCRSSAAEGGPRTPIRDWQSKVGRTGGSPATDSSGCSPTRNPPENDLSLFDD